MSAKIIIALKLTVVNEIIVNKIKKDVHRMYSKIKDFIRAKCTKNTYINCILFTKI